MRRRGRPPYPELLTPREQEVLSLIREGLTNEQIASRLGISLSGARYHVSEILGKLGVSSRAEAAVWREEQPAPSRRFGFGPAWLAAARLAGLAAIGATAASMLVLALGAGVMDTRGGEPPAWQPASFRQEPSPLPEAPTPTSTPDPAVQTLLLLQAEAHQAALTQPPDTAIFDNPSAFYSESPGSLLEQTPDLMLIQVAYSPDSGVFVFRFTEREPVHWFIVQGPDEDGPVRWSVTRQEIPNRHISSPIHYELQLQGLRLSPEPVIKAVSAAQNGRNVREIFLVPVASAVSVPQWVAFLGGVAGMVRCEVNDSADLSNPSAVRCGGPALPPATAVP